MVDLSGYWFLDGIDVWKNFAIAIEKGTSDTLRYPAFKPPISHDWPDQNGIDVDLTKKFFKEREVTLQCRLVAYTESEFWLKHNAFIQLWAKPGLRRLSIKSHGGRSYYVYYQDCSNYKQINAKALKGIDDNMIVHEFNLRIIEPSPQLETSDTFIAADDGAFLII